MEIIGHIHNDYKEKFGVPRQSGLVNEVISYVTFLPKYGRPEAFRGLEGYSHLWLIFQFSKLGKSDFSPTVRPPRLGGNKRVGVFATRSPNRPNPIGLSSVELLDIKFENSTVTLIVSGADLMDGTPILDIKPYLAYTDSHPDALSGFSGEVMEYKLEVVANDELLNKIIEEKRPALIKLLSQDPRPAYIDDDNRVYTFTFGEYEISFTVSSGVLYLKDVNNY